MKPGIFTFYGNLWKFTPLILQVFCHGCQKKGPTEYQCPENYFTFSIGNSTVTSDKNDTVPLTWKYRYDETYLEDCDTTYRDGYEIVLCDCLEFFGDDDDVHFITFFTGQGQLQIIIRRQGADLRGHHIQSKLYYLDKKNRPGDPVFELKFTDKQTGDIYGPIHGNIEITHFGFNHCIEGKIMSKLKNQAGRTIDISGEFRANYTGKM